ncbi:MAG: TonB-dependent receptor plug domain-containing protein [Longimicrobiales bacterium]
MKRRNSARLTAVGAAALTLQAGCALPGHAPRRPAPEDVVSVGYGTQSREDVAGSISSVSAERVGRGSLSGIEQLLEAIPGVQVLPLPGGDFTIRIRGMRTGLGDAEPLLVIDDIPVQGGTFGSRIAIVHPQNIARIDVLKDIASTSVYGVRGVNGVVIVTTRRHR